MKENKDSPSVYVHSRRHSWPSLRGTSRKRRWLRITLAAALIVGSLHALRNHYIYRSALTLKYTPTTFHPEDSAVLEASAWQWEEETSPVVSWSYDRDDFLGHRQDWHRLGGGFEGDIYQHGHNVAKIFRKTNAPFRNCVPNASPELRWPTEISASLILGGSVDGNDSSSSSSDSNGWAGDRGRIAEDDIFLPVTDHFLLDAPEGAEAHWHFLTPFLPLGGLGKLAKRLRHEDAPRTIRELDNVFRPSLERLLHGLDQMHTTHELCHDDIKMDNIFVASPHDRDDGEDYYGKNQHHDGEDHHGRGNHHGGKNHHHDDEDDGDHSAPSSRPDEATHWMLGDLGNVREVGHPYHTSIVWLEKGRNLPDCRSTDVLRLLKVYMTFLRASVRNKASFDRELFRAAEPWSALFWSVRHAAWGLGGSGSGTGASSAAAALEMSQQRYRPSEQPDDMSGRVGPDIPELRNPLYRLLMGEQRILSMATRKLLDVRTSESKARLWSLARILGTPSSPCAAATS